MAIGVPSKTNQVRDSEIAGLLSRVNKGGYSQYLRGMRLVRLRSFTDAEIRFDFPVTALVGPNGGGKTTILGAAGLIYKNVLPRRFFAKSGRYDTSMANWTVEYDLVGKAYSGGTGRRTASYLRSKWNRDAVSRDTLIFGVTRTLPASERKELTRCISGSFRGFGEQEFTPAIVKAVERILGKEAANYLLVDAFRSGKISLYAARDPSGTGYSEFHFGAGEASVIRIVSQIEQAPDNTLILIEEIENGLHPVATRHLVEYLISVAHRKSSQVIFTTHSNDALDLLPSQAVWSCLDGVLRQGKLEVSTLRTLTGKVDARLVIFTEDLFAEEMVVASLREYGRSSGFELYGTEVHKMGGAGSAQKATNSHNDNPSIHFPAICVLDGDKADEVDAAKNIVCFPGSSDPEVHIIEQVLSILDRIVGRLTVGMNLHTTDQERVRQVVKSIKLSNVDPHLYFAQVGAELDFTSEITVIRAFLACWAQEFPEDIEAIWAPVAKVLTS